MLDEFILRAGLAAAGVAVAAGPLGCFVVWRRMAYFGDATAHSALLGVALGIALGLPPLSGVTVVAAAMAVGVAVLGKRESVPVDTLLGVFAHAALALGVVAISLTPGVRVDLMGYLFGDVLATTWADVALIWGGAAAIGGLLIWRWSDLLNATLSEPLSIAEGRDPDRARLLLLLALALSIAIAMQVVGLLLVTSMLILPAATARPLSRTPEAMARAAGLIGAAGAVVGLAGSDRLDTPTGPTIVVALFACFCLVNAWASARRARG